MAQTWYWIEHPTGSWPGTPTGAQIAAGLLSDGVTPAAYSGSETAPGSGTGTLSEGTPTTGKTPGASYTGAGVVYDDVALTYSNVVTGTWTQQQLVSVPAGSLTLTGYAPTVVATANNTIAVPAGALTLTGYAPTVSTSADVVVSVPSGALTLTGYAPTVIATANQTVAVPVGTLTLTGYAPDVISDASRLIQVPAGALTLTGYAPSVVATANNLISVPAGALTLTGYAPTVSNGEEQPPPEPSSGAGKPRRVRQRRALVVEIDGKDFIVESEDEALVLLEKAKQEADQKAEVAVKRAAAAKRRKPGQILRDARKTLAVPEIRAPGLQKYADMMIAEIRSNYESTLRSIEVAALLHKADRDEEDDEDILMLIA